ncbi:hypothetical protein CXG81DRAFT_14879 [Caulochytrium protostelioides]|uniref:Mitochondrial carrier n=1 Tax=Caulochytrium protostelioides TaxID=1555241 RepID=A0A4P9X2W2_9FUNG|nr:hypothetical protein CXG81DRAFT_14879 [Caulochytrium protostelioides]|eukprot:RKO99176.1 hypothetical protein CXG81DRAFT_14879 [Caulochytrium protostelioides]
MSVYHTSPAAAAHAATAAATSTSTALTTAVTAATAAVPDVSLATTPSGLTDLLFGSAAGFTGKLVEYPFDTVKVRLQSQPIASSGQPQWYTGPIDCIRQSLRHEGIGTFFRGLSTPLVASMIENSALFVSYNYAQSLIRWWRPGPRMAGEAERALSLTELSTAGFMSGAAVSLVLTPVELVKCQLQVTAPPPTVVAAATTAASAAAAGVTPSLTFRGPAHVIAHTLRTQGLRGFYRGHIGTFLREAGGGAAWFGTYELAVRHFQARAGGVSKDALPTSALLASGAIAGMAYNASLFPADVIKSRQQTAGAGAALLRHQGFLDVARELYHGEGIRGFYRGFGITLLRSAPTSAVIFATYELLNRHFAK